MDIRIRLSWQAGQLTATLDETPSATALAAALPLVATARTWGEEVYFDHPYPRGRSPAWPPPATYSAASTATRALDTVRDGDPLRVEHA
ncbi:hypothetical protein SRIMHP_16830 [Streptomyces rimosus subsp. rimosus]|uniref:Cyclophilin TM1367-like domain-containing protein n=1 Tax=Streptomyces rimosus subsp. rimosus TaxID=132474 RepID=A0ABY3Z461_STRRM|nr:hypothetical protein SRIMR7_19350 [Streptomyces rimosus subsp. rimosus]UTH95794.1 hypothetical protein SRIMHP_16830 [Streptomyces rimosus subsp. rimosus]UTJ13891.1 hypothetical protein SRIMDV3_16725 [Streptomyces rimosus subsp. rimosus]